MTGGLRDIRAGELVRILDASLIVGDLDVRFRGISTDSRTINSGELFWALKGDRFDGHDFVEHAVSSGAAGAVVEKGQAQRFSNLAGAVIGVDDTLKALGDLAAWWRARHSTVVGAITGSVGKTTTKEMAAAVLEQHHETLKTKGNLNNLIGLPLTLFQLEGRHSRAVLELGMNRPGEIARLTRIADPDVGLITEVGKAHLEGLGNLLGVARAKLELAQELRKEAWLLVNGDNTLLVDLAKTYGKRVLSFGLDSKNHIRAKAIQPQDGQGIGFVLCYKGEEVRVRLQVTGQHNVMNALGAAGLCLCMGEPLESIAEGLSRFKGMEGRFEVVELPFGITLVDDTYNANPVSLKAALEAVQQLITKAGGLIVALGDMLELGQEAVQAHLEAGMWVGGLQPRVFVGMGQYADTMMEGAREAGLPGESLVTVQGPEEMAQAIEQHMRPGDVILLKGSRKMRLDKVVDSIRQKAKGSRPEERL